MTLNISNYDVHRVLVDNESLVDILFYDAFVQMGLSFGWLVKKNPPLIGFSSSIVPVEGIISLTTIVGQALK